MKARAAAIGLVLLVAAACDGGNQETSTELEIGRLTGVPIESVLDELDAEHAHVIRLALQQVPDPLPPNAVSLVKFLAGASPSAAGMIVATPADGTLRTHVILADPGSNSVRIHLLCLRNVRQIPCSSKGVVWDVTLPPSTLVRTAVDVSVVEGDRLDFIALVEGDLKRPEPASTALSVVVGRRLEEGAAIAAAPSHPAVFGGCDFATITNDTSPQTNFRPPGTQSRSRRLFLVVQPCAGTDRGEIVRAVQILDARTAMSLAGSDSFRRVTQPALVMPLPTSGLKAGSEVQVVVLRDRSSAWITHPVRFE